MNHWFAPKWVARRGLKAHFPFAVLALVGALLSVGWRAPAVLLVLLAIVMLPLIYANDASKLQPQEPETDL
jgi:uncharacterized membrane protein YoaK (UPF0700 family)